LGFGLKVKGLGFRVLGFGFWRRYWAQGVEFRVQAVRFQDRRLEG
jgi:hypothetical protein